MEVLTLNATQSNGKISISGTTDPDMLAVAITVYDKSGTNRIALRSTSVINGEFSYEIEIAEDDYQICVADYNGGECKTITLTVASTEEDTPTAGTPETGFQTITKVQEEVTPSTNATSSSAIYVYIAVGLVAAAIAVLFTRRMLAKRKSK
ncbi:hypothetical protein IK112_03720 [Candidatus Saccharibacteria bacterium]|nr:hypothetical protein [Candidatus Saccharibacteria bacterium]